MRPNRIRWIRGCGLAGLLIAAGMPAGAGQRAAPGKEPRGFVWTLRVGDATVYLAGSVHLLREADFPLPEVFDDAYADSDELVFEVDMKFMSSPEAAVNMQRLGTLPPGIGLADRLGEYTYARLQDYFLSRRVSVRTLPTTQARLLCYPCPGPHPQSARWAMGSVNGYGVSQKYSTDGQSSVRNV